MSSVIPYVFVRESALVQSFVASCSMIHSQIDLDQRKDVISKFQSGLSRLLIACFSPKDCAFLTNGYDMGSQWINVQYKS